MAKKTIFFDEYCGYNVAAAVINGKIDEFGFEKKEYASPVGNIYKGRVVNVLPGMNAAFVDCGLERNCYLSADDALPDRTRYDGVGGAPALPELKCGDEIAVQVVKAPVGNKGARVTVNFSFVGKYFIYMPTTPFTGVSAKIRDEELRKNMLYVANRLKSDEEGLVMRTAAPYAQKKRLEAELAYMRNVSDGVMKSVPGAPVGKLLYTEVNLHMRVFRDTLSYDIDKFIVGTKRLERIISDLVSLMPPANRKPVILYEGKRELMEAYGVSEQIRELTSPRVGLENGAYLVIEHTEALTVIDVNTGKFTGDDDLEQTVYYTNILAAREIARQVRLRNIGGIVVVDFIDMADDTHKKALVQELERALKSDPSKCTVAPISQFGLVEFTRKRSGANPLSAMTTPCRHCGTGRIKTTVYNLLGLRARLLRLYYDGHRKIRVDLHSSAFDELCRWEELKRDLAARLDEAEIYCVPHKGYTEEQINCRCGSIQIPANAVKII